MIELTRLNSSSLVVNSDLIQYVESAPDTTLTLVNGEKVVVRESATEVIDRMIAFRARLMAEAAGQSSGRMVIASGANLRPVPVQSAFNPSDQVEPAANLIARRRTER